MGNNQPIKNMILPNDIICINISLHHLKELFICYISTYMYIILSKSVAENLKVCINIQHSTKSLP